MGQDSRHRARESEARLRRRPLLYRADSVDCLLLGGFEASGVSTERSVLTYQTGRSLAVTTVIIERSLMLGSSENQDEVIDLGEVRMEWILPGLAALFVTVWIAYFLLAVRSRSRGRMCEQCQWYFMGVCRISFPENDKSLPLMRTCSQWRKR